MKNYGTLSICHFPGCFRSHSLISSRLDRKILLAGGLPPHELPKHLGPEPFTGSDDSDSLLNTSTQPDDRDCRTAMAHYYQDDTFNGFKSFDLGILVEAQIRTNPESDPDPESFGRAVWATLDADTKTKLHRAAEATTPDRENMGDILYTPTRSLLKKGPYFIPNIMLDTFTTIKAPEVIEWIIYNAILL